MERKKICSILLISMFTFNSFTPIIVKADNNAIVNKEIYQDVIKARKDDLNFLLKTLEEKHPDLYNKNSKEVFLAKAKEIEKNLEKMDDVSFAFALSEITALAGDSHTKVDINSITDGIYQIPLGIKKVEEGLMIVTIDEKNKEALGGIVTGINGMSLEEAKEKVKPLISYDNEAYLEANFIGYFNVYNMLQYAGILTSPKDITLNVKINNEDRVIKLDAVPINQMENVKLEKLENKLPTRKDKRKIYFKKELAKDTLYIQYNSCREDESLPMKDFKNQVVEDINKNEYKKVVVDLRYNGGGSDGVIMPLMYALEEMIKQEGLTVYTLIGSKTFSSALINTVEFKEIGAIIVGEDTGGSVDHFGEVNTFELPNSKIRVRYSTKYFDLSELLKEAEPYNMESFKPDVYKPQTREDYLKGKDTAIEYVLNDKTTNSPKENLTRGQIAVEIGRDAQEVKVGKPLKSLEYKFEDVPKISYMTPYVYYVNVNNIMLGTSQTQFLPDKELTKGELAVVLYRYAKLLNLPLDNLAKENLVNIKNAKPYQEEAINTIVGTKIFPYEDKEFDSSSSITIKEFQHIFTQFKNSNK